MRYFPLVNKLSDSYVKLNTSVVVVCIFRNNQTLAGFINVVHIIILKNY